MAKTRRFIGYAVVSPKSWDGLSARISTKVPSLDADEVAIKLDISVPDTLFNRPQLQAKVIIPESAVTAPVVDATVLDNVREILSQQTGLDVKVAIVEPESLSI